MPTLSSSDVDDVDEMTMKVATTGTSQTADLATLLQSCIDHLQTNELTISSVYLSTMIALQNHTFQQLSHLQSNIAKLEEKRNTLEISCQGKRDKLAELESTVASKQKELESLNQNIFTNAKEVGPQTPQPANKASPQKSPSTAPAHSIKSSNAKLASSSSNAQRTNIDKLPVSPVKKPATNANKKAVPSTNDSSLTPLELQKKAAMEKRRQQVLEERRKAAEEQRRRKEEEHQKFLEYEKRKEELKFKAQKEAAATRRKAREQAEQNEIESRRQAQLQAAFGATTSPKDTGSSKNQIPGVSPLYTTPVVPSSSKGPEPTPSPPVPPTSTTSRQTSGASIGSGTSHNSQSTTMRIPNLPTHIPKNSSVPMSSTTAPPPHIPTGTDTKYSKMVESSSSPTPLNPTPATAMEPSQEAITALKHNVLLHWALVPPHYQVLKPVPHLLCQIHTVFPPCFGVVAHEYFAGFEPISWPDLVLPTTTNQAQVSSWDPSKVKKAVRTIRFFLHPDKLPRDLNGLQQFLCKLLWDVVNDANEDYLKSLQA